MNTTINKTTDDWCKREALGHVLTDWVGYTGEETGDWGYDAVMAELEALGQDWLPSTITEYYLYENHNAAGIAEVLRDRYHALVASAKFAINNA